MQVYPLIGPIEGGTRLTIIGSNLGRSFDNIRSAVTVAGTLCIPLAADYDISKRFDLNNLKNQIVWKLNPIHNLSLVWFSMPGCLV